MANKLQQQGLTTIQAKELQEKHGKNQFASHKKPNFVLKVLQIMIEPMFLLLIVAATVYFILGEPIDGIVMLIFVLGVISIEIVQEWKTDKTLSALKELSAPHIKVIRDGKEQVIASADLVPGDLMIVTEGVKIPADGVVIRANDLCVDESSLTGESEGVWKVVTGSAAENSSDYWRSDFCYAGTLVTQGSAAVIVEKIGSETEYGKIGSNIASIKESPTPLQKQTSKLVKFCSVLAGGLFLLAVIFTFLNISDHDLTERIIESILSGITLAMAMIPEEFPVILAVFLSMGAWRIAQKHSLVRKLPAVETLGAVSVLCVDKTGTITTNIMTVQSVWAVNENVEMLIETMGLACETETFDPMEKAIIKYCEENGFSREHLFGGKFIAEYAFTNELKMMGHVWHHDDEIIVSAKGSAENILSLCTLSNEERKEAEEKIVEMSSKGLRVIAVGMLKPASKEEIPQSIDKCRLTLCGLIGLADPPRQSIKEDIERCVSAGIRIVMITGDSGITASAIAKQIGMQNTDKIITGVELNDTNDEELREKVRHVSIFSRVLPEHKMRIVKAFKDNGEVVAMTGDGVNDAPALKYADIGIAMGKRGSEVSREAADIVLMDDNFTTIIDTVSDGRRIYDNIRKAIGYVFAIHLPIAFIALLAPLISIDPANLFLLPLHVMLLELIIDPTCSIVLERQPAESNVMRRKPRKINEKILTVKTLIKSISQGLIVLVASFATYYIMLKKNPQDAAAARTMGLVILMLASLFLVHVNSSDYDSCAKTFKRLIRDKVMWGIQVVFLVGIAAIIYSPLNAFLKLSPLTFLQLLFVVGISAVSVFWYELVKLVKRLHKK